MTDKNDFFEEYDALTTDTASALHQQFSSNVQRWLIFVEGTPEANVWKLGEHLPKDQWLEKFAKLSSRMGGGTVNWPMEKEARLGAQLDLFRIFARGEWDAFQFAMNLLRTGTSNLNNITGEVVRHIFSPMARDIRRYANQNWDDTATTNVPAADRIVKLDHNSSAYADAIESLNKIRDAVAASNEYSDTTDQEQRLAEIAAGKELLNAQTVDAEGFRAVTIRCLKYLSEKFVSGIIGKLAGFALHALGLLFGMHF